jgi:hypothetical protein
MKPQMKQLLTFVIAVFSPQEEGPVTHFWALREVFEHCAVPFMSYSMFVIGAIRIHRLVELVAEMPFQFNLLCFVENVVFTFGTIIFLAYMAFSSLKALRHLYRSFRDVLANWR